MRKIFLFVSLLFFTSFSFAQTWQDTLSLIEKTFARYLPQNPGCQLSISRNGQVIFSKAWGMADLEHNIPLSAQSIIEAGSVSKQFTAAAILLLEQQGKLSLEDDVRKYIPELPDYGYPIKLRHMMRHTSGLRDWGSIAFLTGWPRSTKFYANGDALEIMARQKQLNNKPGAEFIYSNSNYNLFAIIVQRVSGMSLADFTRKYIFEPAGMTHTQWRDTPNRIVHNRAIAYALTANGFETNMPNEYVYGNGGLLTTTEDLLKWNDFYLQGKLGTASLLSKQIKTEPFNNGLMGDYGAGLFIQSVMGQPVITHSGATASYRANLETFPELHLSIAWLSNSSQFDSSKTNVAIAVRKIFVADKAVKELKNESAVNVTEATIQSYAGWYRCDRDGWGLAITVKDKKLLAGETPLVAETENKFGYGKNTIIIQTGKGMMLIIPNRDSIHYSKADSALVDADNMNSYKGNYFSDETNSPAIIGLQNGKLTIHWKEDNVYELMPTYKDGFKSDDLGGNIYFTRNKENKITSMQISISRARNVAYKKLPE